jgi:hypothetical protein
MSEQVKSYVDTLLESDEMQAFVEKHETLIAEAADETREFGKFLKSFVLEHFEEFVGANLEETYKNIRLFSEVSTMTFINEAVHLKAADIPVEIAEANGSIDDYL